MMGRSRSYLTILLTLVLVTGILYSGMGVLASWIDEVEVAEREVLKRYLQVTQDYEKDNILDVKASFALVIPANKYSASGNGTLSTRSVAGALEGTVVTGWNQEDQWIEFTVEAPRKALYQVRLKYLVNEESEDPIRLDVMVNGKYQFSQMQSIGLNELNVYTGFAGNWRWEPMADPDSAIPYLFLLEKGTNTIRLKRLSGEIELDYVRVSGAHKQFLMTQGETWSAEGGGNAQVYKRVGAARGKGVGDWKEEGHWLEWEVVVEKEGIYQPIIRYTSGDRTPIRRTFMINGEYLYEPMEDILFYHTDGFSTDRTDWRTRILENPETRQPYLIYLPEGTHTIRMEVISGAMDVDYIGFITPEQEIVGELNWLDYLRLLWHMFVGFIKTFN